ncbi:hypothetical protein EVAR_62323_1 [Eumeta japonica]|uniref:Uncharacterized protein n=1 Tax=Eumeta variegata TaxID=151549 RepID=A0A4C1ZHB6_EUMVA|nr:hypothetical protein EVAR_62323_1 [Eumeta japonica]
MDKKFPTLVQVSSPQVGVLANPVTHASAPTVEPITHFTSRPNDRFDLRIRTNGSILVSRRQIRGQNVNFLVTDRAKSVALCDRRAISGELLTLLGGRSVPARGWFIVLLAHYTLRPHRPDVLQRREQ